MLGQMLYDPSQVSQSEPLFMDTLLNDDLSLDELMNEYTNNLDFQLFNADELEATCGAQAPNDNWRSPPLPPYPATARCSGTWMPGYGDWYGGQYSANPMPYGGVDIPIDPALQANNFNPLPSAPQHSRPSSWTPVNEILAPEFEAEIPRSLCSNGCSDSRFVPSEPPSPAPASNPRKRKATCSCDHCDSVQSECVKKRARKAIAPTRKPKRQSASLQDPLSILTADSTLPLRDVATHIMRPSADRRSEAKYMRSGKGNKSYIPRPLNSFMLYRMAYKDRIGTMDRNNGNNQLVSSVAGESWVIETETVKAEFARLAKLERDQHQLAFPGYKFKPDKNVKKGKKMVAELYD
ncbi:MAG: hypothetical protein Q9218_005906 [Villophora microphyllina]